MTNVFLRFADDRCAGVKHIHRKGHRGPRRYWRYLILAAQLAGTDLSAQVIVGPIPQPQVTVRTRVDNVAINGVIGENGEITGSFTQDDATRLANELNAGALPVGIHIIENDSIGPTLGAIDLQKSLNASMLGLGLVLLFMIIVYRLPGFLADVALGIYVLVMLAILALAHATLTLPGIAGFVLSIGMAVDANVLIFERLKEELRIGKTVGSAVDAGFRRAWTSIRDSNISTMLTCVILYWFGQTFAASVIVGFATTLFIGVAVSMFTAIFVTRTFLRVLLGSSVSRRSDRTLLHPRWFGAGL